MTANVHTYTIQDTTIPSGEVATSVIRFDPDRPRVWEAILRFNTPVLSAYQRTNFCGYGATEAEAVTDAFRQWRDNPR